jgi:hypothetical protein
MIFSHLFKSIAAVAISTTVIVLSLNQTLSASQARCKGLILYNQLGSLYQVKNSRVGANFSIHAPGSSKVFFVPGIKGMALATTGGSPESSDGGAYLTMNYKDFFGCDNTKGSVSVWLKKTIAKTIPYRTPIANIFGSQPYGFQGPTGQDGYRPIGAFWGDSATGRAGINFVISQDPSNSLIINDPDWNTSTIPINRWYLYRFVWNIKGINRSKETMQIFRNNRKVASHIGLIKSIAPPNFVPESSEEVRVLSNHQLDRNLNRPILYIDDLRVSNLTQ